MKILKPTSKEIDLFYVFNAMSFIKSNSGEHKRHWISEYQFKVIPLPNYEQQQEISKILKSTMNEINILRKIAENYKTQKRGLMQKLLTGKWRVKIYE
jgi:type I restriction enzyme S subunit